MSSYSCSALYIFEINHLWIVRLAPAEQVEPRLLVRGTNERRIRLDGLQRGIVRGLDFQGHGRLGPLRRALIERDLQDPQVLVLPDDLRAAGGVQIDQFDAEQRGVHEEMAAGVEGDVGEAVRLRLLQVALHGHAPPELHVRELLARLLQFGEAGQRLVQHQHLGEEEEDENY